MIRIESCTAKFHNVVNAWIEEAARNLLKLKDRIDTDKTKAPSFLGVICGSGYAYQRKDGVYVIPIDCLRN